MESLCHRVCVNRAVEEVPRIGVLTSSCLTCHSRSKVWSLVSFFPTCPSGSVSPLLSTGVPHALSHPRLGPHLPGRPWAAAFRIPSSSEVVSDISPEVFSGRCSWAKAPFPPNGESVFAFSSPFLPIFPRIIPRGLLPQELRRKKISKERAVIPG